MRWSTMDWIAWVLVIVGALNWGLIGFFHFDLVSWIFGTATAATRIAFGLVGLAAVWQIVAAFGRTTAGA